MPAGTTLTRATLLPSLLLLAAASQPVTDLDLTVENTAFVLHQPNGKELRGAQLQGAILRLMFGGELRTIRFAAITTDPDDSDLLHHEFQLQDARGQWHAACEPNEHGETWGLPVALPPGHPGREGPLTLACASGAVVQCLRLGYKPWARGRHGENLEPYHAACVNMLRADYAGDGGQHTLATIPIQVHDDALHWRIAPKAARDPSWTFEAGWSPQGAICLAHVRWEKLGTLDSILKASPRLAAVPTAQCTEDFARAHGALIYSATRLKPRTGF